MTNTFSVAETRRFFLASCIALVATAMSFAIRGDIMGDFERLFALSKTDVGWIAGAAFWGFGLSILLGGPLCDLVGMGALLRIAAAGHIGGTIATIAAPNFAVLFIATLVIGIANGLVEATINPLVATLYADDKTRRLVALHAWFPGGIVIGGVLSFLFTQIGQRAPTLAPFTGWQAKMLLLLVPSVIYAWLFAGQRFPPTERAAAGVPFVDMFKEILRPLFIVVWLCMWLTAATELGPGQWVSNIFNDVMQSAAKAGILVLVWVNGIMYLMRQLLAGAAHRVSPVALIASTAVAAAVGLFMFGMARTPVAAFAAAALFAAGTAFWWPTMLGITSERFPRGGALLLAIIGATGSISTAIAGPVMGWINDTYGANRVLTIWAALPAALVVIFAAIHLSDRLRGGYRVERIGVTPVAVLFACTAAVCAVTSTNAQTRYRPTPANLAAREWFQDARFGLFVHWGVYSVLGDGEWVMNNRRIPIADYEKLPALFNPVEFDAAEWVALAKAAGMRYITITSKHHDGFAMFDSKVSDYNIVARTAYRKDVLKALAEECRRQGLKLFFYYSQLDWHHPDYFPRGRTGRDAERPEHGEWPRYIEYMNGQLRELLTNYGEIGGIWFDGWWDRPDADWRLDTTYSLIHRLQPQALIGANHHRRPFDGEDFQMFEKDLPGGRTADFNKDSEIGELPLETCETINGAWGFNLTDRRYKSTRDLIRYLVRAAGSNANFLLNVGPMPNGRIQPEFVTRLREIGAWLAKNGEAIYGTRGGPIAPHTWGVTTRKGNRVYVHVLEAPDATLLVPPLGAKVRSARLLAGGRVVSFSEHDFGTVIRLPADAIDPIDTIVALELDR